ncbi:hypothetical protein JCM10212_003269 [Sporobolomyces blumeae]
MSEGSASRSGAGTSRRPEPAAIRPPSSRSPDPTRLSRSPVDANNATAATKQRSPFLSPSSARVARSPSPQGRTVGSPAPSSTPSIEYVDIDYEAEERAAEESAAANRLSVPSRRDPSPRATFVPSSASRPEPRASALARREHAVDRSRLSVIPSPFLAASDPSPRRTQVPVSSGGAFGGLPPSAFEALRSPYASPRRQSYMSPLALSPAQSQISDHRRDQAAKKRQEPQPRGSDDLTSAFLKADRRIKGTAPSTQVETRDKRVRASVAASRDPSPFAIRRSPSRRSASMAPTSEGTDEENLLDAPQLGRGSTPNKENASPSGTPRLRTRSNVSVRTDLSASSSPDSRKRKREPSEKHDARIGKRRTVSRSSEPGDGGSPRTSYTTDKLLKLLPRRAKRIPRTTSATRASRGSGTEADDSDETDYDEPVSSRGFGKKAPARSARTSQRSQGKQAKDLMVLGTPSNRQKWKEVDEYRLETETTL